MVEAKNLVQQLRATVTSQFGANWIKDCPDVYRKTYDAATQVVYNKREQLKTASSYKKDSGSTRQPSL
jgi:hypothetical protein